MTLTTLRADALRSTTDGFSVRLSLPWIRSLPVSGVGDLQLRIDDAPASDVLVALGDRTVSPSALAFERGWWFVQDRLVLRARGALGPGAHEVSVSFTLLIPYLPGGPDAPLTLPFLATRTLELDAAAARPTVSLDVA